MKIIEVKFKRIDKATISPIGELILHLDNMFYTIPNWKSFVNVKKEKFDKDKIEWNRAVEDNGKVYVIGLDPRFDVIYAFEKEGFDRIRRKILKDLLEL